MQKPRYQDYQAESIETVEEEQLKVRVIAGDYKSVKGPVVIQNPSMLLDVQIKPGGVFNQTVSYLPRCFHELFDCLIRPPFVVWNRLDYDSICLLHRVHLQSICCFQLYLSAARVSCRLRRIGLVLLMCQMGQGRLAGQRVLESRHWSLGRVTPSQPQLTTLKA